MTAETVKIQRPLARNDDDAPWLVYNRSREHMDQIPQRLVPQRVRAEMRRETKGYFSAEWHADRLGDRQSSQERDVVK